MTLRHRCRPRLIAKQERLMRLHSAVVAKMRNTAPPPEEAELYERGWMQDDHGGSWSVWFPMSEIEAWQSERFGDRLTGHRKGSNP
jgi:hypothetical protein